MSSWAASPGDEGVTRGQLLVGGAGLLLGGVVVGAARGLTAEAEQAVAATAGTAHDLFRRSVFAPLVGSRFRAERPGEGATDLRLAEVRPLAVPGDEAGAENAFALRFSGPPGAGLAQDTYMLRHRRLGTFALFVVPMSATGSRREYEAIVNRQAARA